MSRLRQYLVVAVMLGLLWEQLPTPLVWGQSSDATLHLSPSTVEVAAGQTVDVAVTVEDVTDLYGFDITVAYDPAIVEVVDLDPGLEGIQLALGLFLDPGFVIFNQADNNLGQLRLVMTQLNPSEAKSGDGNLMVIRFRARQEGETPLLLLASQLAERNGATFSPQLVDGQLSVTTTTVGQPIAPTPIPSQIAGTPMPTMTPEPSAATATPAQAATAAPTNQPAVATAAAPAAQVSPSPIAPVPTVAATAVTASEGSAGVTENEPASSPVATTEAASEITAAGTALVSELTQANNNPVVVVPNETAAVTDNGTAGVTVIGSGSPAEGGGVGEAAGSAANGEPGSWVTGASLGGGLLLAIIVLFFFLSRKRGAGTS